MYIVNTTIVVSFIEDKTSTFDPALLTMDLTMIDPTNNVTYIDDLVTNSGTFTYTRVPPAPDPVSGLMQDGTITIQFVPTIPGVYTFKLSTGTPAAHLTKHTASLYVATSDLLFNTGVRIYN